MLFLLLVISLCSSAAFVPTTYHGVVRTPTLLTHPTSLSSLTPAERIQAKEQLYSRAQEWPALIKYVDALENGATLGGISWKDLKVSRDFSDKRLREALDEFPSITRFAEQTHFRLTAEKALLERDLLEANFLLMQSYGLLHGRGIIEFIEIMYKRKLSIGEDLTREELWRAFGESPLVICAKIQDCLETVFGSDYASEITALYEVLGHETGLQGEKIIVYLDELTLDRCGFLDRLCEALYLPVVVGGF